jgi:hypothetical protein
MDHRDVVDAARKHVAAGGHVKFRLPVGAFLGGLYHLGNGVFVAKLPSPNDLPHNRGRFAMPPDMVKVTGSEAMVEAQARVITLELCDNPLPGTLAAQEHCRMIPTQLGVKMIDAESGARVVRSVTTGKVIKGPRK